jgi:hypothetical protein
MRHVHFRRGQGISLGKYGTLMNSTANRFKKGFNERMQSGLAQMKNFTTGSGGMRRDLEADFGGIGGRGVMKRKALVFKPINF